MATHVSIEVGLDIFFLTANPGVSRPPASPHFDAGRVEHLSAALTRAYGVSWDESELLSAHRRAVRLGRLWPSALGVLRLAGADGRGGEGGGVRRIVRASLSAARALAGDGTPVHGFLGAAPPPLWMVEEVEAVVDRFPEAVREVAKNGFDDIPDRNLETGGPAGAGRGHAATDAAAARLEELLRTVVSHRPHIDVADR